jgi:hypothetical protein
VKTVIRKKHTRRGKPVRQSRPYNAGKSHAVTSGAGYEFVDTSESIPVSAATEEALLRDEETRKVLDSKIKFDRRLADEVVAAKKRDFEKKLRRASEPWNEDL